MSVVILGGNECMSHTKYKDSAGIPVLCQGHLQDGRDSRLGWSNPDLLVMFTDTISHKWYKNALNETRGQDTVIVRSRSVPCPPWAPSWKVREPPRTEPL